MNGWKKPDRVIKRRCPATLKIEEVTPKQIGDEHGRKKQNKIRQTNREENRQKETGVKVACKGHHRQEGIQKGKTKKQKQDKPGQPHIIHVGQERQPYTYISSARQPR